jgi:hypothetical protein
MPWDLDYALLSYTQLKKSKYYLSDEDKVYVDVTLNLSSHIINWEKTKVPKEFFISKFEALKPLLKDYICRFKIYDGDKLYGHLDTQREGIEDHIDYYSYLNVDMYFSENLIAYLLAGAKQIPNKYFTITPQVPKLWDQTWDVISHPDFSTVAHDDWNKLDTFDVRYFIYKIKNEVQFATIYYLMFWY